MNPSIWFYNVGGPHDYHLPISPLPQLNNRNFNMALGPVLGGGSSINAMVWTRGMQRSGDKRVDPHDCGPRRQADSRLTTGDRMTISSSWERNLIRYS
jgi:choline dehydrogenase-like flavoprotein